jgi:hypothetical protein
MSKGRPGDPVWKNYLKSENDNKVTAICLACQEKVSAKVARLKSHLKVCKGAAETIEPKNDVVIIDNAAHTPSKVATADSNIGTPMSTPTAKVPVHEDGSRPAKRRKIEQKLDFWTIKTSEAQKDNLDQLWAEAFFACNIPFNVIEHPRFLKAMQTTRPGYKLPNRKQLGKY